MSDAVAVLLSIAVLASLLLGGAGIAAIRRGPEDRRRGWLMIGAGVVTLMNVWMWTTMPPGGP